MGCNSRGKPEAALRRAVSHWEVGVSCQLYNNRWGTNCKMWYEEDAVFRFVLKLPEDALNQQGEEER